VREHALIGAVELQLRQIDAGRHDAGRFDGDVGRRRGGRRRRLTAVRALARADHSECKRERGGSHAHVSHQSG